MSIFYILFLINCFRLMNSEIISNNLSKKLSLSKCFTSDKLQLICVCHKTERNQQLSNLIENIVDCNLIYREFFKCYNNLTELKQIVMIKSSNSISECLKHFYSARTNKLRFEQITFTASNLLEQSKLINTLFKIFALIFLLLILTFSFFLVWTQCCQCLINTFTFLKSSVNLDGQAIPNLLDQELFRNNSSNGRNVDQLPSYEEATKNPNTEIALKIDPII